MDGRREYRAESIGQHERGPSVPTLAGIGALVSRPSRDGEIERNPRGMPLGSEHTFGVLFIFDAGGYWRIRWYEHRLLNDLPAAPSRASPGAAPRA